MMASLARARSVLLVVLALLLALPLVFATSLAAAEDGARRYDDGTLLIARDPVTVFQTSQAIEFFTDLPAAVWPAAAIPVEVCTQQHNRPAAVSAEEFREVVDAAAAMWTASEVAVGFSYTGDCTHGARWQMDNGITEIGFDDFRDVVKGQSAAVATGTWTTLFGTKEFVEFDVVLDHRLQLPLQCLQSVVAHELGHVVGLGHSADERDLMYPSFDPSDTDTCPTQAREGEVEALLTLYGEDLAPIVEEPAAVVAEPGATVTFTVTAEDPEGDELTFRWEQLDGDLVEIEADGPTLEFVAPADPGAEVRFLVTVSDPIGHQTSVEVLFGLDAAPSPPIALPQLAAIGVAALGDDATLEWALPSGATSLELCSTRTNEVCQRSSSGSQAIDWETVIATSSSASTRRVFTDSARETSAAACNAAGCGPALAGPLAGGLRWLPWDIDFDYVGMAMDVPGVRITVAGAINLSDQPRVFTLYSGTATNPLSRVIRRCGELDAGESCLGVLSPSDRGHGPIVTIVSSAAGTPTTEHQIAIR